MGFFVKHPDAVLDYGFDWTAATSSTIAESEWSIEPGGASVSAQGVAGNRTAATIGGGDAGCVYRVTNRVTFANGERDARILILRIAER